MSYANKILRPSFLVVMSWEILTTDPRGVPRSTHDLAVLLFLMGAAVIFTFERGKKVRMTTMASRVKFPSIVCGDHVGCVTPN